MHSRLKYWPSYTARRSASIVMTTTITLAVKIPTRSNRERIRNIFSLSYSADGPGCRTRRQLRFDEAYEFGGGRSFSHRLAGIGPRDVIRHQSAGRSCGRALPRHNSDLAFAKERDANDGRRDWRDLYCGAGNRNGPDAE